MEVLSVTGERLAVSSRPLSVPYQHDLVSTAWRCVWMLPLLAGWVREERTVTLTLFEDFSEHPVRRVALTFLSSSS